MATCERDELAFVVFSSTALQIRRLHSGPTICITRMATADVNLNVVPVRAGPMGMSGRMASDAEAACRRFAS